LISGRFNPFTVGSLKFLDTKSRPGNQEKKRGTSYYNELEASLAVDQFIGLAKKCLAEGGVLQDCAIITPYQAQIRIIKKKLRQALVFNATLQVSGEELDQILDELVNTVDAFQGSQRYGIIVSLVRSNQNNDVGFNSDLRRLNVALSRAQDRSVIIGNSDNFINSYENTVSTVFAFLVKYCRKHGHYIELK
jgi:superfamily I DNA and/or RNA helicase